MCKYQEPSRLFESAASRGLTALFVMNLLNYIDRFILAAVIEPVQASLGVSQDSMTGLLSTIFFVSYMIFSPVMGWLGDRPKIRRNYLLAFGVGVWSLATF